MRPEVGEQYIRSIDGVETVMVAELFVAEKDLKEGSSYLGLLTCCDIKKGDRIVGFNSSSGSFVSTFGFFTEIVAIDGFVGHRYTKLESIQSQSP